MNLTFIQTPMFIEKAKRLGLSDDDLQALEQLVLEHPDRGDVMRGTGGVRKIRFAPPSWHTGKSGATRVCYILFTHVERLLLRQHIREEREAQSLAGRDGGPEEMG